MSVDPARAKSLFLAALELPEPTERTAFLERQCGGDAALRERVEELLRAHEGPGEQVGDSTKPSAIGEARPEAAGGATSGHASSFAATTEEYRSAAAPEQVIAGRYTLQEKLGEGGMGEVWVAKQTEPVKRRVALKLIKPGMDCRAVLQRFEHERQALALMDHPNIAKVLDGGITAMGQPFFVMELVNGLPLTKFCDEATLTPRERLELFVPICQAVQHAHQKGVVHRDLKPANILVTMIDGKPLPKVIDFGVAKATAGRLTDESLSTQFGAVVGTLEYMSPEQAGFSGEDVDTRADIYSLGVILYELLTGLRPIDAHRLRQAALTEMIRIIREEEPSRPSTRLSTDASLPSLAAVRRTEPKKLTAMLRELDWVVMKCLEKPRDRRYETASGLARDIQRYLAEEPVEARPPTAGYRINKFVRRHRVQVVAASLVLLTLVAGIIGTTWGFIRAERSRRAEISQRTRAEAREQQAIDAVKHFGDAVANNPELKNNAELESLRKSLLKEPLEFFKTLRERLQADHDTRPEALGRLARAAHQLGVLTGEIGDQQGALRAVEESIEVTGRLVHEHPQVSDYAEELANALHSKAVFLEATGDIAGAQDAYHLTLAVDERLAREHPGEALYVSQRAKTHSNFGNLLSHSGDLIGALREYKRAVELLEGPGQASTGMAEQDRILATTHGNLGVLLRQLGDHDGARRAFVRAIEILERIAREQPGNTADDRDRARTLNNLGVLQFKSGDASGARRAYERARTLYQRLFQEQRGVAAHARELAATRINLGTLYRALGDMTAAQEEIAHGIQILEHLDQQYPGVIDYASGLAMAHYQHGLLLRETRNPRAAREALERALAIDERLQSEHPDIANNARSLADTLNALGATCSESGDMPAARLAYERAVSIFDSLAREDASAVDDLQVLGMTLGNMGQLLHRMGDKVGAKHALERGLEIRERLVRESPEVTDHLSELSTSLNDLAVFEHYDGRYSDARDHLREAIDWQQKALVAHPQHRMYRLRLADQLKNLLLACNRLSDVEGAADARRRLAELEATDPRFAALDERLRAVAKGEAPKDNTERLALAQRAYDTKRYVLAARLWGEASENDPELAADRQTQPRYNAACAAALAACGPGSDEPSLDEGARAELRAQALAWLKLELVAWAGLVESGALPDRSSVVRTLKHWQSDSDLVGIRDESALGKLPEVERVALTGLWSEVERVLKKVEGVE